MPDIFDRVSEGGDIFDKIAPAAMPVKFEGTTPAAPPARFSELAGGAEAKIQRTPGFLQSLIENATAPFQGTPETEAGVAPPPMERVNQALQFISAPFNAISRGVARQAERLPISPTQAESVGEGVAAVAGMIPPGRVIQGVRGLGVRPQARTVAELLPPARPALPPPTETLALPSPARVALPPPENMVMEAGPAGISQAPKRTVVDLVNEVKQDVKAQVIDELFEELKTGRTAAMPRREAPLAIGTSRRLSEPQAAATRELAGDFAPKAPAIELPGPSPIEEMLAKRPNDPRLQALDFMNKRKAAQITPQTPVEEVLPKAQAPKRLELPEEPPFEIPPEPKIDLSRPVQEFFDEASGRGVLVHPSTKQPGKYQVTYFDKQGFSMDEAFKTQTEAIKEARRGDVYQPSSGKLESLAGAPEFSRGNELTRIVQMGNELRMSGKGEAARAVEDAYNAGGIKEARRVYNEAKIPSPDEEALRMAAKATPQQKTLEEIITAANAKAEKKIAKVGKKPVSAAGLPEEPPFEIPPETTPVAPQATFTRQAIPEAGAAPEVQAAGSAARYEEIQKELSAISRNPEIKGGDRRAQELYNRVVDLEAEAEIHKPAAIAKAQAEIDARKSAPEIKPKQPEMKSARVDPYAVAGRAIAQGINRQGAYSQYVKTWGLRGTPLELDAKDFGRIYDLLKSEKGQISIPGRAPPLPGEPVDVSMTRLTAGGLGEESSKTLSKTMGPEGGEMARLSKAVRNDAEIEANTAKNTVNKTLKGLDAKQQDNLVDVLEGKAKPIDAQVQTAAAAARTELDKVAARASQVGLEIKNPITGEKTPFQPRGNYYPHMFEKELGEYVKDPFSKAKIKAQIKQQMGPDTTDKQVEQALNAMLKATRGREGHLEIARVFDLGGYSRDPGVVLNKHFQDAYRRINIAEKFGPDLAKGEELLTGIGGKAGNRAEDFARTYFERVTGTEKKSRLAHEAVSTAVNLNNFSLLGQAAIANASQPVYTGILAGVKNTAKGYAKAMTAEGKDFASKILGTSAKEFMEDVSAASGKSASGKMADVVLKYTGFNAVERLNRIVAANAGREYARNSFEKLLANPNNKRLRETLDKMNVDVEVALKRGALSEMDELKAGQNIVNRTQFKTDVTELPLFWTSEAGRLLTQYKRFQFKSGQFVKDEILKEMAKGNIAPLARAAAIAPAAGAAVVTARDAIRFGKQTEEDRGLADYLAAVGTFGAFSDAFAKSGRQPVRGLQYLAGPTLGRAGQAYEAVAAITQEGNLRPAAKLAASSVPVVGPSIRSLFNEEKKESPRTKLLKDLGIKNPAMERKRRLEELRQ